MAIYDIDENVLFSAYDKSGNETNYAYDINGTKVFQKTDPFAYNSISQIYNKSRNNAQGLDIYGNCMVVYRDDTYSLEFINMTTWNIDYTITTDVTSHGNDLSFSSEFYNSNDPFPILYVASNNSKGLRIDTTNLSAETVKTINNTPTGNTWVVYGTAFNDDMSRYYTMGYNTNNYADSSGFIFLETWDISESLENPTRLRSLTREWFPCIQGMAYHDGLLWVASGMNDPVKVFAINPSDASIVKTVNLTRTGELEGIGWGEDNGEYFCVYGQIYNGITYYRIDFSPTPIT